MSMCVSVWTEKCKDSVHLVRFTVVLFVCVHLALVLRVGIYERPRTAVFEMYTKYIFNVMKRMRIELMRVCPRSWTWVLDVVYDCNSKFN